MSTNPFTQLETLVQDAEVHRQGQKTAEVQRYLDTHPALPQYTRNLTHEIKEKIIYHLANGDTAQAAQIRGEVEALQAHIATAHEPGNILFSLLAEEITLSYLMMRQADTSHARIYGQTSIQALRRADTAHVRFMRSLRTLASIQKLTPFINLNWGTQQIIHN
jgi:hypothetical protein